MRTLLLGIDSGTQSTKALVVDALTGKMAGAGPPLGPQAVSNQLAVDLNLAIMAATVDGL
jgi:sugar (pentulose or hexulose) kinase